MAAEDSSQQGDIDGTNQQNAQRAHLSTVTETSNQIDAIVKKCMHAGRMGVVRVDMQGVQALQSNPQVQAIYVYIGPISVEEWAQQQTSR